MRTLQVGRARAVAASLSLRSWQRLGWYALIPWLLALLALAQMPGVAYADEQLFVPMVLSNRGAVEGSDNPAQCALAGGEAAVLAKMASHPEQRRPSLTCDPILASVARARAEDMADRDYFGHVNPDGIGPNYLVEKAGFALPEWYDHDRDANNIESIAAGFGTANEAWAAWMESNGHRTHLLALDSFYAQQVKVGVGYASAPGTRFEHYWVIISAPDPFASPLALPE
jgi:uncharacterized protein YkwD